MTKYRKNKNFSYTRLTEMENKNYDLHTYGTDYEEGISITETSITKDENNGRDEKVTVLE